MNGQEIISEVRFELILWITISTLAMLLDYFICSRYPPAEQPKAVRAASRIEFCTGGFLVAMATVLMLIEPLPGLRFAFILGFTWIILSWLLRRGHKQVRWFFIPLSILRLLIPVFGWIVTPLNIYFLFINKDSRSYFKETANQSTEAIA